MYHYVIVANAHGALLIGRLAFAVATVLYCPLIVHEYAITTSVRDTFPLQIVHPSIFLHQKPETMLTRMFFLRTLALVSFAVSIPAFFPQWPGAALGKSVSFVLPSNMSSPLSAIHPPNDSASAPFVYEVLSAEASFFSSDSRAEANANPVCDGDKFGKTLKLGSCTEAWGSISVDTYSLRLSQRGFGPYDVQLPHRRSSCKFCQTHSVSLGVPHLT